MFLCLADKAIKMKSYYVNQNAQSNGDHKVHAEGCTYMPYSKTYLGDYDNCAGAVAKAKASYLKSNGCKTCCNSCHTI